MKGFIDGDANASVHSGVSGHQARLVSEHGMTSEDRVRGAELASVLGYLYPFVEKAARRRRKSKLQTAGTFFRGAVVTFMYTRRRNKKVYVSRRSDWRRPHSAQRNEGRKQSSLRGEIYLKQ